MRSAAVRRRRARSADDCPAAPKKKRPGRFSIRVLSLALGDVDELDRPVRRCLDFAREPSPLSPLDDDTPSARPSGPLESASAAPDGLKGSGTARASSDENGAGEVAFSACTCDPVDRFLYCTEFMDPGLCPVCHRTRRPPLSPGSPVAGHDHCGHASFATDTAAAAAASGSTYDGVIYGTAPGVVFRTSTFAHLNKPYLCDDGNAGYAVVYVPSGADFCKTTCKQMKFLQSGDRLGRGAFGEVWPLSDGERVAKISERLEEVLVTVWLAGVVRARAREPGICGDSVYHNILASTACCLRHKITVAARFPKDLYRFTDWNLTSLPSYRRAFVGLADGLRFLNTVCGISHCDITPMNILVNAGEARPTDLTHAVLCDYSLSEPHPNAAERCVLVFEETKTARTLDPGEFLLSDAYHPAYKPICMQLMAAAEPTGSFRHFSAKKMCVTELCALGNVVLACLSRLLDDRGVRAVQSVGEAALFKTAEGACRALEGDDIDGYVDSSLRTLGRQVAGIMHVMGDAAQAAVDRVAACVSLRGARQSGVFKESLDEARQVLSHEHARQRLIRLLKHPDGDFIFRELRGIVDIVCEADLDADPFSIFPSCAQ